MNTRQRNATQSSSTEKVLCDNLFPKQPRLPSKEASFRSDSTGTANERHVPKERQRPINPLYKGSGLPTSNVCQIRLPARHVRSTDLSALYPQYLSTARCGTGL